MDKFIARYLEFSKPFIDSIRDVYSTMIDQTITPGKPELKKVDGPLGTYSSIIGMNGKFEKGDTNIKFKGSLLLSWEDGAYLKTSGGMLGEDITEYTDDIKDVGMEIANIVMGGAKTQLNPEGFKIEMSTPTLVTGENHVLKSEKDVVSILTPFDCEGGKLYLEINYWDEDIEEGFKKAS